MVIQCNPFVANPPIFEIVGDPSPNPPISRRPWKGGEGKGGEGGEEGKERERRGREVRGGEADPLTSFP